MDIIGLSDDVLLDDTSINQNVREVITVVNGTSIIWKRIGKICIVCSSAYVTGSSIPIPTGFQPYNTLYFPAYMVVDSLNSNTFLQVVGNAFMKFPSTSFTNLIFNIVYITNDD